VWRGAGRVSQMAIAPSDLAISRRSLRYLGTLTILKFLSEFFF
jgi:hypothetical protein